MNNELFPMSQKDAGFSSFPLENWMKDALKNCPHDCEALARITNRECRRSCFIDILDYRDRGVEIVPLMLDRARIAVSLGETNIGGIRLIGAIWIDETKGKVHKMSNETACFYAYVLTLLDDSLAPYIASECANAKTLKKAGWRP